MPTQYERGLAARELLPKIACACGCGTMIPPVNGFGRPIRFVKNHDKRLNRRRAENSSRWRGGEWKVRSKGRIYYRVTLRDDEVAIHPTAYKHNSSNSWSIQRSHYVWNTHNPDNPVRKGNHVHHINHITDDDRIENLRKMDATEHLAMHGRRQH